MINLEQILDQIQELIGARQGDFYNLENRIRAVEAAHNGLVAETRAIVRRGSATVTGSDRYVTEFPDDFLTFAGSPIVYQTTGSGGGGGGITGGIVFGTGSVGYGTGVIAWGAYSFTPGSIGTTVPVGQPVELCVVSSRDLESMHRAWDADARTGTPHSLVIRSPRNCELFPSPREGGQLEFSYISNGGGIYSMPAGMALEWLPFGGDPMLNQFAPILAYKVASDLLVARNPEAGAYVRSLYDKEIRKMRHAIRYDPAKDIHVAPKATNGRYAYASFR